MARVAVAAGVRAHITTSRSSDLVFSDIFSAWRETDPFDRTLRAEASFAFGRLRVKADLYFEGP